MKTTVKIYILWAITIDIPTYIAIGIIYSLSLKESPHFLTPFMNGSEVELYLSRLKLVFKRQIELS